MRHDYQDRVSMEIARRICAELPNRPEWLHLARTNLVRWRTQNHDAPGLLRCYAEWETILDRPLDHVRAVLSADTHEGQRLRQNSPFVGALVPQEIWDIKREMRYDASAT